MSRTASPASASALRVPPVAISSTPYFVASSRANSTSPVLSDTLSSARRMGRSMGDLNSESPGTAVPGLSVEGSVFRRSEFATTPGYRPGGDGVGVDRTVGVGRGVGVGASVGFTPVDGVGLGAGVGAGVDSVTVGVGVDLDALAPGVPLFDPPQLLLAPAPPDFPPPPL